MVLTKWFCESGWTVSPKMNMAPLSNGLVTCTGILILSKECILAGTEGEGWHFDWKRQQTDWIVCVYVCLYFIWIIDSDNNRKCNRYLLMLWPVQNIKASSALGLHQQNEVETLMLIPQTGCGASLSILKLSNFLYSKCS